MTRIAIVGGPLTGKTTLAGKLSALYNVQVYHTDDLKHLEWSEASEKISHWFDRPGDWIIEGVAAVRALRKWKKRNPFQKPPVTQVIHLWNPQKDRTPEQVTMAKGEGTIFKEIKEWLGNVVSETAKD